MKKYIVIVILNFLVLTFFICILEYISYKSLMMSYQGIGKFKILNFYKKTDFIKDIEDRFSRELDIEKHSLSFKTFGADYKNKESIIIFGCSMVWGFNLKDEQTFSYKISKKLKSTVYNLAYPGGGFAQTFYILNSDKFKKIIQKEPKYILYFYQSDHLRRMIMRVTPSDKSYPAIFYKEKNGKLVQSNAYFAENSYLYNLIAQKYIFKYHYIPIFPEVFNNKVDTLLSLYLQEIYKKTKELYPNSKFIIIAFNHIPPLNPADGDIFENYNVINIPKLTNINIMDEKTNAQWAIDNGMHPNEKYWDTILPIIIREMKKF